MDFGGALRRVGEIAQDRRDPFDQEGAAGVVGRPVDRAGRLRIGAGEVERDAPVLLDHLERELVQLRIGDAVVLDVVFPDVFAVGDLRQQLVAIDVAALVEDGLEAGLDRLAAEALEQRFHAPRAHHAGLDLAVEIGRQHLRHAGVALDDGEHRVVAHAFAVELDRRDREAFLEHGDGGARHRARHAAADVVVMAERLDVGDHLAVVEHRHGAAQVGQMADAAFGQIRVVHQEHVARPHGLGRKVAHHRVRHRRIGAAGELAAIAVEQADAIIVRLADHRAARGALDGVFDLGLDRIERALDDLQHDRIDRLGGALRRDRPGVLVARGGHRRIHRLTSAGRRLERTISTPCGSTSRCWPGNTTVVEPNSSTTAGPSSRKPGSSEARS